MYVGSLKIKDRVTLYDRLKVAEIAEWMAKPGASKKESRLRIKRGVDDILKVLTYGPVRFYHRRLVNEVLLAAGLIGNEDKEAKAPVRSTLTRLCAWFAAELSRTPHEIATGLTPDEVQPLYVSIQKKKLESWLMAALVHHSPEKLKDYTDKIRAEIGKAERDIKNKALPRKERKKADNIKTPSRTLDHLRRMATA